MALHKMSGSCRQAAFSGCMAMREQIEPGLMVFIADGESGIGAVREVREQASEVVVNVQNAGDFVLPFSAIRDVHSGKVLLDMARLDEPLRDALRHVHDAEDPNYEAPDRGRQDDE